MTYSREHAQLRNELRDFYEAYAVCLDEEELERWPDFFTEDCRYRVTGRENYDQKLPYGLIYCINKNMLRDRVLALRQTTVYEPRSLRHFISSLRIHGVDGDTIRAQANFAILESLSDREPVVNMVGRYIDTIVRAPDGFLLKDRDCIIDNYRIRNSLIIPV
ncbi:aromatic-ring-hydroxylating dioxygenase subunit beta [Achromobacter animicus]|uniref:aromatic-ring-hydroxylating dioxygenase subunit beta n=1 Tax=Achromobacter animicus TaxID=1389935 RepID=UPI002447879D|nr:aromatic-ring-hydroxylating dioxygenase subunit beta [Achromobacter animicus]MDH0686360.1 aromatic-ring-hydroxylating dioxygenase subunit beta [Achromobacter animicus]